MDDFFNASVQVEFMREVNNHLSDYFHPLLSQMQESLSSSQEETREALEEYIKTHDDCISTAPVLGVDASNCNHDYGEVSTALACGVVSSTTTDIRPKYFYRGITATSSETFSRVGGCLRNWAELAALRYALAKAKHTDAWVMYDGSFTALNMELCKFAALMPKKGESSSEFLESRQLRETLIESLTSNDSHWFSCFALPKGKGIPKVIAIGKRGVSKYFAKKLTSFNRSDESLIPSDKTLLGTVLKGGEYAIPLTYEQCFEKSHGSSLPGYGTPSKAENFADYHALARETYAGLRIVHYRPYPWSPVLKIEYNAKTSNLQEVLSVVRSQMQIRALLEPLPLYLADVLSKQASSAIHLYGNINSARYPELFKAYRTK